MSISASEIDRLQKIQAIQESIRRAKNLGLAISGHEGHEPEVEVALTVPMDKQLHRMLSTVLPEDQVPFLKPGERGVWIKSQGEWQQAGKTRFIPASKSH